MDVNTNVEAVATPGHAGKVDLIAGVLCLDFVNTVEPRAVARHGGQPREYLTDYGELIAWCQHATVLTNTEGRDLLKGAANYPARAQAAVDHAVALREVVYRIFFAIANGQEPYRTDLDALTLTYAQALRHAHLVSVGASFDLAWHGTSHDLDRLLWPIARSAFDLLMRGERTRVKDCPTHGAGCGWLFYDTSKNKSRRWCSMQGCGTPEKERRRAKRRRGEKSPATD
jgi:predicted RNA-binding Zn ribbon-like protein